MNSAIVALIGLAVFYLAYRYYSVFIGEKIFGLDEELVTPAHEFSDGTDFVPTPKHVLFGHHYASIAGAAPILGPAIAVIWGWVPAVLWVVLGSVFIGAVHDLGSLVVSVHHKGQSIGKISETLISPRVRTLFLGIIFLLILMVIPVFARAIAKLFVNYPGSVIPINFEIFVAVAIGVYVKRTGEKLLIPSLLALGALYLMILVGWKVPVHISQFMPWLVALFGPLGSAAAEEQAWIVLLMVYGFIAATLPVWVLLQPRDFINSHQLILALGLIYIGIFTAQRVIVAPMINLEPIARGTWYPLLFVTIACGAISGFHSLVSSGTTSKQLSQLRDSRMIGFGGMLGEGTLALAATLAVSAGFASRSDWLTHYHSWEVAAGSSILAFIQGSATFLQPLGFPASLAMVFMSVVVISFAATSLDTAFRLQCYIFGEVGQSINFKPLASRRVLQAGITMVIGLAITLMNKEQVLWPLFGSTNQMVGALALLVISIWVMNKGRNYWFTLAPMLFVSAMTTWALTSEIGYYRANGNYLLLVIAVIILLFEAWILYEAWHIFRKRTPGLAAESAR
ncbi:MAG: carbon starvation protein A [Candidatus Marinimicrobia bacterium]|nr:carbon starvation protein A [Candidatus Neomarinimicrobiota bacterium]